MSNWLPDGSTIQDFVDSVESTVIGAYLLPDTLKFRSKYYYKDYITECLRILTVFFITPSTMMNPNMNYGGLIPIAPITATSSADISFPSGSYGRGAGMISLTESAYRLLDALMLLESFGTVQTLDTTTAASIATTVAGVKAWFNTFASWMDTGLIGRDERYMPNNHGSVFVATYAHIAVWTQNATLITNAKYYIGNYTVNNTGVSLTYTTNEFPLVVSGQVPSFYTQFDSTAQ